MSNQCDRFILLFLVILVTLAYMPPASPRGTETPTISLPEIESAVANSLDLGNSNVEQTAVTIAKDYPGEYNINQVSEIFKTLRKGWFYFSDPSYKNKYKNANRTLQDGKMSNTIGMGNCDDFAILMASLIASLGGSTRITFASNASSTEGHAYCEVFLGQENDSQVNDLINWTKSEYSITEIPGLNKTENEVWLNLDWWAENLGGPYFEGDRRMVIWQSASRNSPRIVPVIDTLDSTAGWETIKDGKSSNISISTYPARKGLGINVAYDLKKGGWVGIAKNVSSGVLAQVAGLNISCYAEDKQNTIELRLAYADGTEFGYSWKPDLGKWVQLHALYEDFKCMGASKNCSFPDHKLDPNNVEKLKFIISSHSDGAAGPGKVILDHVQGEMNIPVGSAWARVEEQRETAIAVKLAYESELARNRPEKISESVKLAVESLRHNVSIQGDLALRRGLMLLPRLLFRFKDDSHVRYAAFNLDGSRICTVSGNYSNTSTIKIWEVSTGRVLTRTKINGTFVFSPDFYDTIPVSYDPYHERVAALVMDSGFRNKRLVVLDAISGEELLKIVFKGYNPRSVVFSPDGTRVAIAFRNEMNNTQIYRISDGKMLTTVEHNISVISAAFNQDGTKLATASYDDTARIWDAFSGRELFKFATCPAEPMMSVALNSDDSITVTASESNIMIWHNLWDVKCEETRIPYSCDTVIFSPDNHLIATASNDGTARIWDLKGRELARMAHKEAVNSVAFSRDSKRLITASDDYDICIWDFSTNLNYRYDPHDRLITFSPDSTKIEMLNYDGVAVVDTATHKELSMWEHIHPPGSNFLESFSPNGSMIAVYNRTEGVKLYQVSSGKELSRLDCTGKMDSIVFSPTGTIIGMIGDDKPARIWNASTCKELARLEHNGSRNFMAFNRNGTRIALQSNDKTVGIWETATGSDLAKLKNNESVYLLAFSPDGTKIAIRKKGQNIARILDAYIGRELFTIKQVLSDSTWRGTLGSATFSPDGNRIAILSEYEINETTHGYEDICYVLDASSGKELFKLKGGNFRTMAFSPDGTKIATADSRLVTIWDAYTGREIAILEHDSSVFYLVFSPDSNKIATQSSDSPIKVWSLRPEHLICDACGRLGCNLTSQEWLEQYCSKCNESIANSGE